MFLLNLYQFACLILSLPLNTEILYLITFVQFFFLKLLLLIYCHDNSGFDIVPSNPRVNTFSNQLRRFDFYYGALSIITVMSTICKAGVSS